MLKARNHLLIWFALLVLFGIMITPPAGTALGAGSESGQNGNPETSGNTDNGGPNTDGQNLNENDYSYEHDYNYDNDFDNDYDYDYSHDYDYGTENDVNHDYNYSHDYNYDYDWGPRACLYNGEPLVFDQDPIVIENRTLVELRGLFEAFGGQLNWDQALQAANGSLNGNVLQIRINNRIALLNGQEVEMDVPAVVMNGRIMVPLRFMSENFGKEVRWDDSTGTAYIDDRAETAST